jgi:hypothetical protein
MSWPDEPAASPPPDPTRSVLLSGLRTALGTASVVEAVPGPLTETEWGTVLEAAEAAGIAPLLYAAWRDGAGVPAPVLARLRAAYIATGSRNALRQRDLVLVLNALAEAGTPSVLLKGAALVDTVYRNPALRPMVDVDLLVPRERVTAALAALARRGYRPNNAEVAPGALLAYENELALFGPTPQSTPIELHWSLLDSPYYQDRIDMDWYWRTARPHEVAGIATHVLCPEAQLLHLAAHWTLHHPGDALLWQHDIAAVIVHEGSQLDWSTLVAQARVQDFVLPLQAALRSATGDWQVPIDPAIRQAVQGLVPSPAERRVHAQLVSPRQDVVRRLVWDVQGLPGWAARGRFLTQQLLPRPAYMRARYGVTRRRSLPAAYLRRWWRGIGALTRGGG